ncbi:MAG: tetratricopeptide repeat protein [Ahrensia sp.]|nr:tetratricopeptide repeat protein [Ahrensia sp.]
MAFAPLALADNQTAKTFATPVEGPAFATPLDSERGEPQLGTQDAPKAAKIDEAFGAFQRGYYLTAFSLALPRAEAGDPNAQTLIGELYANGYGVARDVKKALEWYRFGAEGGNPDAQFALGNALLQGTSIELNREEGRKFLEMSAKAGHVRAAFNLAQLITSDRPTWAGFKNALPWYRQAAEGGLADAQYAMANIHAEAKGVNYGDDEEALKWLRRAAIGGFDTAQMELGVWLANGRGGKKDPEAAFNWMKRAAAQRNIIAQNRLARMYAFGVGTPRDKIRAAAWHVISSRAGFSDRDLDRFFRELPDIDRKRALEAANQLDSRIAS